MLVAKFELGNFYFLYFLLLFILLFEFLKNIKKWILSSSFHFSLKLLQNIRFCFFKLETHWLRSVLKFRQFFRYPGSWTNLTAVSTSVWMLALMAFVRGSWWVLMLWIFTVPPDYLFSHSHMLLEAVKLLFLTMVLVHNLPNFGFPTLPFDDWHWDFLPVTHAFVIVFLLIFRFYILILNVWIPVHWSLVVLNVPLKLRVCVFIYNNGWIMLVKDR